MTVTPYLNFFSLLIFGVLLIPAVISGLCGKNIKYYGIAVSIPCLCLIMGVTSAEMIQFMLFMIYEIILVMGYYHFSKRAKSEMVYYTVFALSILPIIVVKIAGNLTAVAALIPYLSAKSRDWNSIGSLIGFVGISYVSFRIWQLIIEIHDSKIEKLSFINMIYFITFFPAITSGPIDRYNRFLKDLNSSIASSEYAAEYLIPGLKKIYIGVIYKFVIAAAINILIIEKIPKEMNFVSILIYMYAYTFYLFFDFAGYSSFAIGTSYILGIKTPENFNKPFLSRNMKEFWDRWHISLSKWFGDYLFSRFVLNTLRNGTFKSKKWAIRCGYIITMVAMGFWHGFHLFYIIYGAYHGLMLVLTDVYIKSKIYKKFKSYKFYDAVSILICFHIVAFGMLIFSGKLINI